MKHINDPSIDFAKPPLRHTYIRIYYTISLSRFEMFFFKRLLQSCYRMEVEGLKNYLGAVANDIVIIFRLNDASTMSVYSFMAFFNDRSE